MKDKMLDIRDLLATSCKEKNGKLLRLLNTTFNINYFSYQRINQDGNYINYINDPDYFNYYLENNIYQNDAFLVSPSRYEPGRFIHLFDSSLDTVELPIVDNLKEIQKIFKFTQSILIKKNYVTYYEMYIFSIPDSSPLALNSLVSQAPILDQFIDYFHKEFKQELALIENFNINLHEIIGHRFTGDNAPSEVFADAKQLNLFKQIINPIEYQLQQSVLRLTNREKECLFWLVQGKSAQETGEILSISRRTVETLRENCRHKFGSHYTFSNLIYLLGKYDLF